MSLHYQLANEIQDRYTESIIYHDGSPIYVQGPVSHDPVRNELGLFLHCNRVGKDLGKDTYIPVSDERLSDGPFILGYVNGVEKYDDETGESFYTTSFCQRIPVRRWKQGLTSKNITFQGRLIGYNKALRHDGFAAMLEGKYPSLIRIEKALGAKKIKGMAFDRRWMFQVNKANDAIECLYRGSLVGHGDTVDKIKLSKRYEFLQESFEIVTQRAVKNDA